MIMLQYSLYLNLGFVLICLSWVNSASVQLLSLKNSDKCRNDISRFCDKKKFITDFQILKCLQNVDNIAKSLSDNCQHFVWNYKNQLITKEFFNVYTEKICEAELAKFSNCKEDRNDETIICLLKNKHQVDGEQCLLHINELASVIFSDILVIKRFLSHCTYSINQLKCGRMVEKDGTEFSSKNLELRIVTQTKTIDCLVSKIHNVTDQCRQQILRLGEIQADDYRLNPEIFHYCSGEREILCGHVKIGDGKVYECLMKNKFHVKMSSDCRKALKTKHKIEAHDYKARQTLMERCSQDIAKHSCVSKSLQDNYIDMNQILYCLVEAKRLGELSTACSNEIMELRSELVHDPKTLDVELVSKCQSEINAYCPQSLQTNATVIDCLLKNGMPDKMNRFSLVCRNHLIKFIKIVDPTENIKQLDPITSRSCRQEIRQHCNKKPDETNEIYECLLRIVTDSTSQDINSNEKSSIVFSAKCRENLLTLAFYIEQDYTLNNKLYHVCHRDAVKFCKAPVNMKNPNANLFHHHAIIYCLVKRWNSYFRLKSKKTRLSQSCSAEIRNIVKLEASSLQLNYKVYTSCWIDVNKFCGSLRMHDKMNCLQLHFKDVKRRCQNAIKSFLSLDAEDFSLRKLIGRSCGKMVQMLCKKSDDNVFHKSPKLDSDGNRDYLRCLIENKHDTMMDTRCRIALDHYQMLSLNETQIDHSFIQKCQPELNKYCTKYLTQDGSLEDAHVSKSKLITCLSRKLTRELLENFNSNGATGFSDTCLSSLQFEFIKKSDFAQIDTDLHRNCSLDIKRRCKHVEPHAIVTCLNEYQQSLTSVCESHLVSRSLLISLDSQFDLELRRKCRQMIATFCSSVLGSQSFKCLHQNIHKDGFDLDCHKLIVTRLRNRLVNVRLNPYLIQNCRNNIQRDCNVHGDINPLSIKDKDKSVIVDCLKRSFLNPDINLQGNCRELVFEIIVDSNMDINLDPELQEACHENIQGKCADHLVLDHQHANGKVQECLKMKFLEDSIDDDNCKSQVNRLLKEGFADVHVDPQLYAACRQEISKRMCESESLGYGRKLSCLLWAMDDQSVVAHMSQGCLNVLMKRKEMWEMAAKMSPPKSVRGVLENAAESESRYYLLLILMSALFSMLIIGVMCGRYFSRRAAIIRRKRF